jgi:hypothetical protein
MNYKVIIFFLLVSQELVFSQIQDSIFTDDLHKISDSSKVLTQDTLGLKQNSNMNGITDYLDQPGNTQTTELSVNNLDSADILNPDSIYFIHQKPHSNQHLFISRSELLRNDYRYTGDIFKVFPFSFERSYAFIGQPNDIYLYGVSSNSSSYFIDGVPLFKSPIFQMDFNHIQSEDIDSIEIVPLPRGFFYGFAANSNSVNFIGKNIVPDKPYSRIKYYEGPFGEAFLDGMFSLNIFRDLIASLNVTNRKVDDSFKNSDFAIWQVKTKLRYRLSNNFNLIGNYYYSKSETGINGGINVDRILQFTTNVNSLLFNETRAPVYFENNSLNSKQHNFGLKFLAEPIQNSYTSIDFYYKFSQTEYHEYDTTSKAKTTSKDEVLGVLGDQRISFNDFHLTLQAGYQKTQHTPLFSASDSADQRNFLSYSIFKDERYFISPMLYLTLFDSLIIPSFYYKHTEFSDKDIFSDSQSRFALNGWGTDLTFHFYPNFNLYLGYSSFESRYLNKDKINSFEVRIAYNDSRGKINLSFFSQKNSLTKIAGAGFNASYLIWKILLEGRISQYLFEEEFLSKSSHIPQTVFNAGIFYKNLLFNSNLDLKAGFTANYTGAQKLKEFPIPYVRNITSNVEPWLIVDFTFTAEIQKAAIVYFTWENLFDWMYYITPYYPMLERNIRFGIAWEIFN